MTLYFLCSFALLHFCFPKEASLKNQPWVMRFREGERAKSNCLQRTLYGWIIKSSLSWSSITHGKRKKESLQDLGAFPLGEGMGWPEGVANPLADRLKGQITWAGERGKACGGRVGRGIIACPFDAQVPYITKDFSVSGSTRKKKSTLHHVDEKQVMDGWHEQRKGDLWRGLKSAVLSDILTAILREH